MNRTLENIYNMMMRELDVLSSKGELDETSLCFIDKMVDIIKDIGEIDHSSIEGYSNAGRIPMYPYDMNYSYNNRMYNGGNSYAGGGNSYRSGGGYSRDNEAMDKLNRMMNEASSPQERETIRKIMDKMSM